MSGAIDEFLAYHEKVDPGWPTLSSEVITKIPYFGSVLEERRMVKGGEENYYVLLRNFGWAVVFGLTQDDHLISLAQWKPGVNQVSWELPPGGVGEITDTSWETVLPQAQEVYLRETGHAGGEWLSLGTITIETGKYRGTTPTSNGFYAHLILATGLEKVQEPRPQNNELFKHILVPRREIRQVLESGYVQEESMVACLYRALLALGDLTWKE